MTVSNATMKAPFGVVDMGSNGIRFGIVTALARHLPVAYEERAPISLLEAQGDEHYIPAETMDQVILSFLRFKTICRHEDVDPANVKVIATEATRIASNSDEFLSKIKDATGWTVDILSKEQEATISSMGIVGAFYRVNGLTMDLGGGSVELSFVTSKGPCSLSESLERPNKRLKTSASPVSLPYGAAIMRKRLSACCSEKEKTDLYQEIVKQVAQAKATTNIPNRLGDQDGYTLYMSGGGFRALGFLDMAITKSKDGKMKKGSYPIPIISGYTITGEQMAKLVDKYKDRDPEELVHELKLFRISKRRTRMLPATCFLVSAIIKVIKIKQIYFSEGGARQGMCYQMLPYSEQIKDPLLEGIQSYVSPLPHALSPNDFDIVMHALNNAIPALYLSPDHPLQLHRLVPAAVRLANQTTHYPKETRACVAFHMPLASGPLANIPGLLHSERAILALILAYRQGGNVPDPVFNAIETMVGKHAVSVCKYVGRLMEIMFLFSPRHPGRGLEESGIKFRLVCVESDDDHDANASPATTLPMTPHTRRYYTTSKLEIVMPKKLSPMLEAPAVISVIQSMDKKVQPKKFDMGQQETQTVRNKLFTMTIVY